MKIYINADTHRQTAIKAKENLVESADELDIEVVMDINQADIIFSIGGDGTFLKTARLSNKKPII